MKILEQEIPLQKNLINSFKTNRIFWLLLILSEILDFLSTVAFMNQDGIEFEANAVIQWLALHFGIKTGVFFGKSLQFFAASCFSALSLKYSRAVLILFIALNLLATLHNFTYF